ncbi:MAG: folate family ECF transporter S component [Lacrimispora saccharolytica]
MSKNPSSSEKKQNMFLSSSQELKKVPVLAVCAMFAALALILNSVASISIGPYIKIGFSAIPNQLVDYLFGPVTGSLFAGILDIVKYVMKPDGAFFFGFTFNAMLAAFIYGCFYYKKKLTLRRVLLAKLIVVLVVNVLLSTLWLDMLYGKGFLVLLPARAIKNLIMWPIDSVIFFALTRLIEQTGVFRIFRTTAR